MRKGRIFIVEDESLIAMELRDRLEHQGYVVCGTAARGEDAVDKVPAAMPDIVLMDIRLAGKMDGIEAARLIRELVDVPVIYLTAYADASLIDRATATEPFGYLAKPFDAREVVATIEMALYKNRTAQALRRNAEIQSAVNRILKIAMSEPDIDGALSKALDVILSIRSLAFEPRGGIFLTDQKSKALVMRTQRNLPDAVLRECARVPFGTCLCGEAAQSRCVVFGPGGRGRDGVGFTELAQFMHYCVPIMSRGSLLGVVNIATRIGYQRSEFEEHFLLAVADALAGVIVRDRAETAQRESERKYRVIVESIPEIVYHGALRDDPLRSPPDFVSGKSADITGYSPGELTADPALWGSIVHPDDIEALSEATERIFRSGRPATRVYRIKHKDLAEYRWIEDRVVPQLTADGVVAGYLGVARDITDSKQAEAERDKYVSDLTKLMNIISRSQKEWQQTFDGIGDMISIHDKQCVVVKANKAFAAFLGVDSRDVINKKCHELVHGTCDPVMSCPHVQTLGDGTSHTEEVHDPRSGKTLRVSTFPWYDDAGAVAGSIHIAKDITQEKDREMRLILAERLASLGQMASGIAHEINNPLAAISGCAEGLLARVDQGRYDAEFFARYLRIIEEEVARCKNITTNMLSFVRKASPDRKLLDIPLLMDKTLDIIGIQGRMKKVKVVKRYQADMPPVPGSEGEIRQLLLAMFTNAIDAMEEKGALTVEVRSDDDRARITITDTGAGISAENQNRIFDPFFTTKSESGGTGLGLSIAKKIISNHKGTIDVLSTPGKGTTFTIILPFS